MSALSDAITEVERVVDDFENAELGAHYPLAEVPAAREFGRALRLVLAAVSRRTEETSVDVASIAARGLEDPRSLTPDEIKAVCGSALTQVTQ